MRRNTRLAGHVTAREVFEKCALDDGVNGKQRQFVHIANLPTNAQDASLREQLDLEGEIMGARAALDDSRARQRAFFEKSKK
mgnify:CR=1 FL=1